MTNTKLSDDKYVQLSKLSFFRQRYRRESEEKAGEESADGEGEKENIIEKTKHRVDLERKAEDGLKPVADKLHIRPW